MFFGTEKNLTKKDPSRATTRERIKEITADISLREGHDNLDEVLASGVDQRLLIDHLISTARARIVAEQIEKFDATQIDYSELADRLIKAKGHVEKELGKYVLAHMDQYQGVDHEHVAELMIKTDQLIDLLRNLGKLKNLSFDFAKKLLKIIGSNNAFLHQFATNLASFDLSPQELLGIIREVTRGEADFTQKARTFTMLNGVIKLDPGLLQNPDIRQAIINGGITEEQMEARKNGSNSHAK